MRPSYKIALTVWIVVLWLGFTVPQLTNYKAQAKLQTLRVQELAMRPPETGWYQINGGLIDYPHTVGHEVNRVDDRGMSLRSYESYVPYYDPDSGKLVLLVLFQGAQNTPTIMREIDADLQTANVNGTIDSGQRADPDMLEELRKEQVPVDPNTPILLMFGSPPREFTSAFVGASVLIAAFLLILVHGVRWNFKGPLDPGHWGP